MTVHSLRPRRLRHLFNPRKAPLERAFEIADSGEVLSLQELLTRLNSEGCYVEQVQGKALRKQLIKLIETARVWS